MITICKNIKPFSVFQRNGETEGVAFDVVHALKITTSRGKFTAIILIRAESKSCLTT